MGSLRDLLGGSERFKRNFSHLATSNTASQVIGLAALPLLSRAFSPADFGSFAVFSSLYSIVLSFSALRVDWLIPRAKTSRAAGLLQIVGLISVIGVSVVSLFVLLLCVGVGVGSDIGLALAWLPVAVLFGGAFLVLQAGNVWRGVMKRVGIARVAQAITVAIISLGLGFVFHMDSGLILGYVIGLAVAFLFVMAPDHFVIDVSVKGALNYFRIIARRRRREISGHIFLAVTNVLLTSSPILLLQLFFEPEEVGAYSIAFRVAVAPVGVITGAIAYSFVSEASNMIRDRSSKIEFFYKQTVCRLAFVSAGAVIFAILASFALPAILGGKEWAKAGHYLLAVIPYLFGVIVFSPTTHLFLYGKSVLQAVLDTLTLVATILAFIVSKALWNSPVAAIAIASSALLCGYLVRYSAHISAMSKLEARLKYA